ncbi:MAG: M28 family peptidase, partial [Synergistaceae bacterium]|nr:M28 family peptidase [Synergistaceae bacterium]
MLTVREEELLSLLEFKTLLSHFDALASLDRRSDGEGEGRARKYLTDRLRESGVSCDASADEGILGFGGAATLCVRSAPDGFFETRDVSAKAWNFSAGGTNVAGVARFLPKGSPSGVLDYLSSMTPFKNSAVSPTGACDLAGRVVLSRSFSPPVVLDAASRGAVGFVICWPQGDEEEIHHSGTVMWWGTPGPEESAWAPDIPVVAVNKRDGDRLVEAAERGELVLSLSSESAEEVVPVHRVEATIPSTTGDSRFILAGAHLDSKYLGATDNAAGAALALSLAVALSRMEHRRWGVKICWWSGHEFGRYTGSSLYARDRFDELERDCVAYANIDMPGMRGATDWSAITAGPDLFDLAARAVLDVTGQRGVPAGRVRAWDQSFQNLGVSSLFVWSSRLPPNSPCRTGGGAMPWWWHTEADTSEFCDPKVFETDARLYMTALV